jgi:uncharacterized protein
VHEPFPGSEDGRPFGTFALIWALPAEQRREIAWIELADDASLRARGRQWCGGDQRYELSYELETSSGYVTERLAASVTDGPRLTLVRGGSPELEGTADCDLGFSPLTNAMPVLRDRLQGNGTAFEIDVAWVSVPDLTVHRDHQIYEPLAGDRIRFRSPEADFERSILLTPQGFVLDYPDIAQLLATVVRVPLGEIADWDSFHAVVAGALELPPQGGRGLAAWVECLLQSDRAQGAPRYAVPRGTSLTLHLDGLREFAARCPQQHAALVAAVAEVNRRRAVEGEPPLLALSTDG